MKRAKIAVRKNQPDLQVKILKYPNVQDMEASMPINTLSSLLKKKRRLCNSCAFLRHWLSKYSTSRQTTSWQRKISNEALSIFAIFCLCSLKAVQMNTSIIHSELWQNTLQASKQNKLSAKDLIQRVCYNTRMKNRSLLEIECCLISSHQFLAQWRATTLKELTRTN